MAGLLLFQIAVILVAARLCGLLLARFGQPRVIGEMAAGILLGPIVFGAALPDLHAALFPAESLPGLSALSTLGLVLFMFVIGAELRAPEGARAQVLAAARVAGLSALLPFGLALAVAPLLHGALVPEGVGFWPFAMYLAVALSVTAFPVLARILKDRELQQTRIGRLSLSAAALLDVAAWVALALLVALTGDGGYAGLMRTLVGLALLLVVIFAGLKPLFAWLLHRHAADGKPSGTVLAALLVGLFACAAATEWLHVHAVFGAFLFGACLPRDARLMQSLVERIEHLALVLLMPVFFALAGLDTTADAFTGAGVGALLLILAVAVVGKLAGGGLGARLSGYSARDSVAVGSLMNARGMIELIVMKVGLDAGLIGPEMFTLLLLVALTTTLMTGPLLTLSGWRTDGRATAPDGTRTVE
ncbi:cation/H(+) antiporter [Pseudoxanthomonas broegbernensis]|uniref:Cation/H(+) antiporter n=1 Tax=Pseudoxanthomonas broegbernensis TaxID=83619 RepID=A0A7V8GLC9_9GAMM|nr:cation:proton antiporter [Pseudoxanthomonas broegbernensis]KAF1685721.1 cation/H(+) antiporter [Pseudoxanthomonas broegbernensis]MBB6066070.1 Kef-type K+ transport system membrane component KefB [Pseudoxanthomonas broegbernensis]